jgi:hypothetical protein
LTLMRKALRIMAGSRDHTRVGISFDRRRGAFVMRQFHAEGFEEALIALRKSQERATEIRWRPLPDASSNCVVEKRCGVDRYQSSPYATSPYNSSLLPCR